MDNPGVTTREELTEEMRAVLELSEAGQSETAIARALNIAIGTVKSRRSRLRAWGLLEKPPPRGGGAGGARVPAMRRDQGVPAGGARGAPAGVPAMHTLQGQVDELQRQVEALWQHVLGGPAGMTAVIPRGGKVIQWTVRLTTDLVEAIKTEAAVRGVPPSHLVEEGMRSYLAGE